jgi:hypothetical protein
MTAHSPDPVEPCTKRNVAHRLGVFFDKELSLTPITPDFRVAKSYLNFVTSKSGVPTPGNNHKMLL